MNEPSIFTKIINGEIPSYKIFEDEKTFAFLDIFPTVEGHTLVVPKKQVEFLWDLTDEDYTAVMLTVKRVSLQLREVLNKPYVGETVIGTDVPHAHVHLKPFTDPNDMKQLSSDVEGDHAKLAELAERLRIS